MAGDLTPSADQDRVLRWARLHHRDLPWRHSRDPWAVLVSEVMLQQTQVDRVVPRWRRFLELWPTTAACAAAGLREVLVEWQGLGYPRRARSLHATAQRIEAEHGGRFPDDLDTLLALPGIGPYTARAVLAFAFEADAAVIDTNVGRILARRHGAPLTARRAQALADEWVPGGRGWAWNQSLLDLGSQRCRPRDPDCADCPVAPECAWFLAGRPEPDPASGSAAVSRRQSPFDGSVRQARGRLMAALGRGPLRPGQASDVIGSPRRAGTAVACDAVVASLVADGLVVLDAEGTLRLAD